MIKHIKSLAEFQVEVRENPHVLVDFWAQWCGPCKMIGPVLEAISDEHPGLTILKVDVDSPSNQIIAAQFRVNSIPTMVHFKNGQVVGTQIGFMPKAPLVRWLGL
ncbi:MAG: thioredoxin [Bacilli bacterium]|jgi:thioredoxin 1|nr:thioredoxin [Bacilli bacterium]MDD3388717.1 thioredoxin [Bacilli bacterium]MDD4344507.1 thioredoxin [Bacilli bacterium]MDD4520401.1 thioredoxin [Bacilli bacterium]MDY0399184.1 thioredoxin [Bacilli bacterium]